VSDDPVLALAASVGVTAGYSSWQGQPVRASREAVIAVLGALGHPIASDADAIAAREAVERERWASVGPTCAVAWDGELDLRLRVPAELDGDVVVEVELEVGGGPVTATARLFALVATDHAWPGGVVHCVRHLRMPLPAWGYHRARWRVAADGGGEVSGETPIIGAPSRAWGAPATGSGDADATARARGWGVFAPVYAVRERARGGAGDLGSLSVLAADVARRGGTYIGTLPLLAGFLDELYQASPYAPASRLAWNELYLDLFRAPGLEHAPAARALLAELAGEATRLFDQPLVDYRAQYAWRRQVIDALAAAAWASPLADELAAFSTGHALGYAVFRAIGEQTRAPWTSWTDGERAAAREATSLAGLAEIVDGTRVRSHLYAQWAMEQQLAELAAGGVGLYLDLPVGVGRDSYDVFRASELFAQGASTGAPPDPLFVGGQDWGLPPLLPERNRAGGWRYVVDVVRHHMRHARMLRVDHVMGLHRLYWVPVGFPATDGVYVHYPAEELWAVLVLESHRNRCAIAGEDLGTVPPEVPSAMRRVGASGLYVRQFVMPPVTGVVVAPPLPPAIACLNTHDTPTFAGWWAGDDIEIMRELGLLTLDGAQRARAERADQKRVCVEALVAAGALPAGLVADAPGTPELVVAALYAELATGPAHDVLVTAEDLWLETSPQNVPGTSTERPNWCRPWSKPLSDALTDPAYVAVMDTVAKLRSSTR
jgi:4-alpha-glucanotransferase